MTMSRAEGKADIQVTRPGHIFPFGTCGGLPLPNLTQCCRFSIPERLPLQPFRQDRLPKLPLPPSLMAASSKTVALTGTGVPQAKEKRNGMDYAQKISQLEKSITFLQESHADMLKSLHEEISELKQKNRELQFQLVTGFPALPPPEHSETSEETSKLQEKIDKLEKDVKKLRIALKDAIKSNTSLTNQLQSIKKDHHTLSPSATGSTASKVHKDFDSRQMRSLSGPSPEVEEYSDTLKKIQKAAGERTVKSSEGRYNDRTNNVWPKTGNGYVENRRNYNYTHHRMMHNSHSNNYLYQQPRLPRLPLRNQQQNYMPHQHYDSGYRQKPAETLPTLKQSHSEHQNRRQRTQSGQSKMVERVYNH